MVRKARRAAAERRIPLKVVNKFKSRFDAQGSYTGTVFIDQDEKPVQDVDDL